MAKKQAVLRMRVLQKYKNSLQVFSTQIGRELTVIGLCEWLKPETKRSAKTTSLPDLKKALA